MEVFMNIVDNVYVAFDYRLTLDSGEEIDKSAENQPISFITGARQVIPGLERRMMGMTEGDKAKITVAPEEAYGPVNPELIMDVPRSQFPAGMEIKPDMVFNAQGPQGVIPVRVKEIKDDNTVIVDLNHSLAGKTLNFDINIVEVRELTDEELSSLSGGCGCGCDCSTQEDTGCGGSCGGCG
jgi:FKBP-type peptidyl-prolyl cis-trans isomerase SlyD